VQTIGIAGTTALGVGIDLPQIRFAIHPYPLSSLVSFDQEVGRIGRDGQRSASYLFLSQNRNVYQSRPVRSVGPSLQQVQEHDYNWAMEYSRERGCLRQTLERVFNQQTLRHCLVNEYEACQYCGQREQAIEQTVQRQHRGVVADLDAYSALEEKLTQLQEVCYWCRLQRGRGPHPV
jgi:superfamily II DNA helicase RecQ